MENISVNISNGTLPCVVLDRINGGYLSIITIVGSIIAIISTIGNGIVITAFFRRKSLQKPCNIMLSNIAFCDMVLSIVCFPIYITPDFYVSVLCDEGFVHFRRGVIHFSVNLSLSSLFITSFERFVGIEFPFRYQMYMTKSKCSLLVFGSWGFSLARAIHSSFGFAAGVSVSRKVELSLSYLIFVITLVMYSRVYYMSRRHLRRDAALGFETRYSKSQAAVLIAFVFFLCWLIPLVIWLIDVRTGDTKLWRQASLLSPLAGTVINLYVYSYRIRDFREAIISMLTPNNKTDFRVPPLQPKKTTVSVITSVEH